MHFNTNPFRELPFIPCSLRQRWYSSQYETNFAIKHPTVKYRLKVSQFRNVFLASSMLPKKTNKQNSTKLLWYLKSNCFNHFWGELKTPKRHFEIDWPLAAGRNFRRTGFSTDCRTKSKLCVKYKFSAEPSIPLYSNTLHTYLLKLLFPHP